MPSSNVIKHTKLHDEFLHECVKPFLVDHGFYPMTLAYHDLTPREGSGWHPRGYAHASECLREKTCPTSIFLKHSSDAIAVSKVADCSFMVEVKVTPEEQDSGNMAMEALPLLSHVEAWKWRGVRCLYVHWDESEKTHHGFWTSNVPYWDNVLIPIRNTKREKDWYVRLVRNLAPDHGVRFTTSNWGSGEPFMCIRERILKSVPDWRDLVAQESRNCEKAARQRPDRDQWVGRPIYDA